MCEQCEQDVAVENEKPTEFFGESVVDKILDGQEWVRGEYATMLTQQNDLAALKRMRDLQKNLQHHVNILTEAAAALAAVSQGVKNSVASMKMGSMPKWFEAVAFEVGTDLQSAIDGMNYNAARITEEYLD